MLSVTPPQPEAVDVIPQDIPLDVVYEDGDVIVVNKPVGMVVHPAPGHPDGTLVNALLYHCGKFTLWNQRGSCARASSTASTGTPPASSSRPKTTAPTWPWQSSSRTTPCYREYEAVVRGRLSGGGAARWTPPSPAIPQTGSGWRCDRPGQGREAVTHWIR